MLEPLFKTLGERKRPEDVAQMIIEIIRDFRSDEKAVINKAAQGSLKKNFWGYTSMLEVFQKPVGANKQMTKVGELFAVDAPSNDLSSDPIAIANFIRKVNPAIKKEFGNGDFKKDRLNKVHRKTEGLGISKRKYNKLFRLLCRVEKKLLVIIDEWKKYDFQNIAKHGLAHQITWEEFSKDVNSACFIAYYNARCNLRSQFTIRGQQRPYDEIADMLFKRATGLSGPSEVSIINKLFGRTAVGSTEIMGTPNWWAMAHVYPSVEVVRNLTDEQKGILLGQWTSILADIATFLEKIWKKSNINRKSMIVRKGNDSSTWNSTAGAWNKARDNWMSLIYAMGMDDILEIMCFGKVLRLMAGDVAYWHQQEGKGLDLNTFVWNGLPFPWEVFAGKATCTKSLVRNTCFKHGLDPEKSGWIAPRQHQVSAYKPTPELVHGVSIGNPFIAKVLKDNGYFSGKHTTIINPSDN